MDNSGRTTIRSMTLYADNTAPAIAITNPISGQISSNNVFTVQGTVTDNLGLSNVFVQANGGVWIAATNVGAGWSADVVLAAETNVIRAYALDMAGNASQTNSVVFRHIPSAPLTVQINGGGTVTPNYNGAILEIGKNYSMTAQANSGSEFVNWTGSITTTNPMLSFVMQSNLTF